MRVNEPITQHEKEVPDGEPLVSRTDPAGRITFVNRTFAAVSEFSAQELIGSPHNLVRHPHMPPAAFANLWATIKAGQPWDGLVKNRTRSGDFYWVRANVTPVVEDDRITGYISIRSKPTRAQVAAADQAYTAMREGKAKHLDLRAGELVKRGWRPAMADAACSVLGRMAGVAMAAIVVIVAVGWLGFSGMAASNDVLRQVYERDLVSVNQLRGVLDRMRDNRNQIAQLTVALSRGVKPEEALRDREPPIRAAIAEIAKILEAYEATELTPQQRILMANFSDAYGALLLEHHGAGARSRATRRGGSNWTTCSRSRRPRCSRPRSTPTASLWIRRLPSATRLTPMPWRVCAGGSSSARSPHAAACCLSLRWAGPCSARYGDACRRSRRTSTRSSAATSRLRSPRRRRANFAT